MDRRLTTTPAGRVDVALVLLLVLTAVAVLVLPVPVGDVRGLAGEFWLTWGLCLALLARAGGGYRPSTAYLVPGDGRLRRGALAAAAMSLGGLAATLSEASRLLPAAAGQVYLRDTSVGLGASRLGGATRFAICAAAAGGMVVAGWALVVPVFGPEFAAALPLLPVLAVAEVCLAPSGQAAAHSGKD